MVSVSPLCHFCCEGPGGMYTCVVECVDCVLCVCVCACVCVCVRMYVCACARACVCVCVIVYCVVWCLHACVCVCGFAKATRYVS